MLGIMTIEAMKRMCRTTLGPIRTEHYLKNRTKKELCEIIDKNGLAINKSMRKDAIVKEIMEIINW